MEGKVVCFEPQRWQPLLLQDTQFGKMPCIVGECRLSDAAAMPVVPQHNVDGTVVVGRCQCDVIINCNVHVTQR